jgi:hypothetical protein
MVRQKDTFLQAAQLNACIAWRNLLNGIDIDEARLRVLTLDV